MREDVRTLKKIVLEGNGQPSLVQRVTNLEVPVRAIIWISGVTLVAVLGIAATIISDHFK